MKCLQTFSHTVLVFFLILGCSNSLATEPSGKTETVVLLHGLGRTARSMAYIEARLTEAGYTVFNYDYESRRKEIDSLADDLQKFLAACCMQKEIPLHFVTHSLGGILVRALIAEKKPDNLARVVMLSPPNKGSESADFIKEYSLFKDILGPAAMQLGTGPDSFPNQLGPADFELGIITGDRTIDPVSSWLIPGKDDGKVAIERTKLEGRLIFLLCTSPTLTSWKIRQWWMKLYISSSMADSATLKRCLLQMGKNDFHPSGLGFYCRID